MMTIKTLSKEELIERFNREEISKVDLGKLRRICLKEILDKILQSNRDDITGYLSLNKSKIDRARLSKFMGYGTTTDSLRQTYKKEIEKVESVLKNRGVITGVVKTNSEVHSENVEGFTTFIQCRLEMTNPEYFWPVNNNGRLFHRVIWAMYLDQPVEQIKSAPNFFYDKPIRTLIADIDAKLACGEILKTLDYASESALDEMSDCMTSSALRTAGQRIKKLQEQKAALREENKKLEKENYKLQEDNLELQNELNLYKQKGKSLNSLNKKSDIKLQSVR
jgi:hypothetical protein